MSNVSKSVELSREVPVVKRADVLVIGGGPSGIAAAVSASRAGAKTVLVEKNGYLGGMGTAGLVGPFMTSYDANGERQIIKGVFEEVVRKMVDKNGALHPQRIPAGSSYCSFIKYGHAHVTPFEPEALKMVAFEIIVDAGVDLILHSFFVTPLLVKKRIEGGIIASKSGLQAIEAKVVIDCTGDGDVAYTAGASMLKGRAQDGKMMPATMFFRVGNVDSSRVKEYIEKYDQPEDGFWGPFRALVAEAKRNGDFPLNRDFVGVYETNRPGEWRVNATRILDIDGTDVCDLTKAEIVGRKQVQVIFRFLRSYVPGFEEAVLIDTGAEIGIRETRRVVGKYVLTHEDLLNGVRFSDTVALAAYPIDIHNPDGSGGRLEGIRTGNYYTIPYRSLVSKDIDQLLVGGRAISASHEAAAAIRVQPIAFATGQAAGAAAALAVSSNESVKSIDIELLQELLRKQGVVLD